MGRVLENKFYIVGKVIHGEGRGRNIGFPTANLDITAHWLPTGVYGVRVCLDRTYYFGVMNIGVKPTFHSHATNSVEIYIIDFSDNIYGKLLEVESLFKIREERKFNSVNELIDQIKKDIALASSKFQTLLL